MENVDDLMAMGKECIVSGEYDQARVHLNHALELEPDTLEAYKFIGGSYLIQGNRDAAHETFNSLLATCKKKVDNGNDDDAITYLYMGYAYARLSQDDEALSCFEKAIDSDPDFADAYYELANMIYAKGDNDEEAEKYYKLAIERNPRHATALFNLGNICLRRSDYDGATGYYGKAIELNPSDHMSKLRMGIAHYENKNYQASISCLKELVAFSPTVEAYNHLCRAHDAIGDRNNALDCVVQAARLGDPKAQQFLTGNGVSW